MRPLLSLVVPKQSFYFLLVNMDEKKQSSLRSYVYQVTGCVDEKAQRASSESGDSSERSSELDKTSTSSETDDKKTASQDDPSMYMIWRNCLKLCTYVCLC